MGNPVPNYILFFTDNTPGVKIAIPYSLILDIDRSTAMDFSETIEVKVVDRDEHFTMDSYFFAYFQNLSEALEQIREVVRTHRQEEATLTPATVVSDTTIHRSLSRGGHLQQGPRSAAVSADSQPSGFRLTSLLRPFSEAPALLRRSSAPGEGSTDPSSEYTHVHTLSPLDSTPAFSISTSGSGGTAGSAGTVVPSDHRYPPSTPPLPPTTESVASDRSAHRSSWSGVVPSWLRPLRIFPSSGTPDANAAVTEVLVSPIERHDSDDLPESDLLDAGNQLGFSILEVPDSEHAPDAIVTEKFRQYFALDDKESLVGRKSILFLLSVLLLTRLTDMPGSLFRVLPLSGRMYVSTNYFCFRSSQPLTKTRVRRFPDFSSSNVY